MKHLLAEALPFLETYLRTLIASYAPVQPDGTYRPLQRHEVSDAADLVVLDEIASLEGLIPRMKAEM